MTTPAESDSGVDGATTAASVAGHPSPIVASAFRGGYGFHRGGGRGGRGRGDVKTMIASKTWVRKKPGDGDAESGGGTENGGAVEG